MRSEPDAIVSAIMAKWSAGFSRLDADALASLYSNAAFFFGSNPTLYRGRQGVEAYFNALPRWRSPTVEFADVTTAPVGADLINMAGTATFCLSDGEPPLSVKITWVIIREDGDWKSRAITSHRKLR
jgi:ketosteroid isomerase-like protein